MADTREICKNNPVVELHDIFAGSDKEAILASHGISPEQVNFNIMSCN